MKYVLLLLILACSKHEMKFKVGECFTGGNWLDDTTKTDSDFGNTIYWQVNEVNDRSYSFMIHQINSKQYLGAVTQHYNLVENVLEKIKCPR